MQIHDVHSIGKSTTPDEGGDYLVQCRPTMVGLHANASTARRSTNSNDVV
jgi:hypothetical protein